MSGHRNFSELRAKMSPERRARNAAETEKMQKVYLLSQIRQQVGLTQAEVANRLGISQPTYAECEYASRNFGEDYRRAWRQVLLPCRIRQLQLRVADAAPNGNGIGGSNARYMQGAKENLQDPSKRKLYCV